jgi:hypothetical protein
MPKVFAFDVDETLEISNGPVTLQSMMDLRIEGHVVGLCGNWQLFCSKVNGWHHLISFINLGLPKDVWLLHFREQLPSYEEYILVGNIFGEKNSLGFTCGSYDSVAAANSGWRFIREDDFAAGVR